MDRRNFVKSTAALAAVSFAGRAAAQPTVLPVEIDAREADGVLPHVWEECAGSDRAAITLRESWRRDLTRWVEEIGLKRVRFHGILADELGVYAPTIQNGGRARPNFQNVFEVYDGLLAQGVSPFVELSFMPKQLASGTTTFGFYQANITPPKSVDDYGAFIATFVRALADRYGVAAVRSWPFEVWNEPNLPFFWRGNQQQYFDLYKAAAVAIKSVDPTIKVGGPATSNAAWIPEFAAFCAANNAPLDFVTTHSYAGDRKGPGAPGINDAVPAAVAEARRAVDASAYKGAPLWLTEWSSDSPAMIAHVVKECLPHVRSMSHWALSGAYEELGVADAVIKEGDNGWPALLHGIARPSFNTYKLLHALGSERLRANGPALATRARGGGVSALVWNLAEAQQAAGVPGASAERKVVGDAKTLRVRFGGLRPGTRVGVRFVDQRRGSPLPAWRAMGSPQYLTPSQVTTLRKAADLAPPTAMRLDAQSSLSLDLPPEGVALIETARSA